MTTDPLNLTSLHSLDFGSVYSPDGREHPITALTTVYPMYSDAGPSDVQPPLPSSGSSTTTPGGTIVPISWPDWKSFLPSLPPHFGARLVVGLVAIGIILIVAARLTLRD